MKKYLLALTMALSASVGSCGWASDAVDVAAHEVAPDVLLKKYMWFKQAKAALDEKKASIGVYDARLRSLTTQYEGVKRRDWARDDREQASIWASEEAGIKASFNDLAADYNAKMAEINWAFTNVGQLPRGATEPLPREFTPYLIN